MHRAIDLSGTKTLMCNLQEFSLERYTPQEAFPCLPNLALGLVLVPDHLQDRQSASLDHWALQLQM
jgi:hypothetical protein